MKKKLIPALALALSCSVSLADTGAETKTGAYFDSLQNNNPQKRLFLYEMPKGGDLHNHRSGSTYVENLLSYAVNDNACLDSANFSVKTNSICSNEWQIAKLSANLKNYNDTINAWSMRNFVPSNQESAHDHFFATFLKYLPLTMTHRAQTLTEVVNRAGNQNENYLETMISTNIEKAMDMAKQIPNDSSFEQMQQQLTRMGIEKLALSISSQLDQEENYLNKTLGCGTPQAQKGCQVTVRYQTFAYRSAEPAQVFAQLLMGFIAASKDPRIVGVNIVAPEDDYLALRDYKLHMQMYAYLHQKFPNVSYAVHAGELTLGLVTPENLSFHINDAVNIAQAKRIGHGVDISYENNSAALLQEMAKNQIAVEINLSSNQAILGVAGDNHPFNLYRHYQVPVVLSTDDEGVLRTNLTEQYLIASNTYHLTYLDLKNLARNSITYSFLRGDSLWANPHKLQKNTACQNDSADATTLSASCSDFLQKSEKAKAQWELEKRFSAFENKMSKLHESNSY